MQIYIPIFFEKCRNFRYDHPEDLRLLAGSSSSGSFPCTSYVCHSASIQKEHSGMSGCLITFSMWMAHYAFGVHFLKYLPFYFYISLFSSCLLGPSLRGKREYVWLGQVSLNGGCSLFSDFPQCLGDCAILGKSAGDS